MLDAPQQPICVQEYVVQAEVLNAMQQELEILDLSFYDILAGSMCSGSSSSKPATYNIKDV